MWNAWLGEAQGRIKIAGRNFHNLWYTADTILVAETEEELKSPLMKVKEESNRAGSMLFSQNIPPSPSPTESKSLFCTSVSLFLFWI